MTAGIAAGLSPHPLFNPAYYVAAAGEEARANPLHHYLTSGAARGLSPHPLFDPAHYVAAAGEAARANPLLHYLTSGAARGLSPYPLFDPAHYVAAAGEAARANPLLHYLMSGAARGLSPHPLFDPAYYVAVAGEEARANPLLHYVTLPPTTGLSPHPLFDAGYYLGRYPDVLGSGLPLLVHYVRSGGREGRQPHPLFDLERYAAQHPDVLRHKLPALLHYVTAGAAAGSSPCLLFDPAFYVEQWDGPAPADPLSHYLAIGAAAGLDPHPLFDSAYLRSVDPEAAESTRPLLVHYAERPAGPGPSPHPLFDPAYYQRVYVDLRGYPGDLLVHYLIAGDREGRKPHPLFDPVFYRQQSPGPLAPANALVHYLVEGAERGLNPCPLFSTRFYQEHSQGSRPVPATLRDRVRSNPLADYVRRGARQNLAPNPSFDPAFYTAQLPVRPADPLVHYLETGADEGHDPHPDFDQAYYRAGFTEPERIGNPLEHYLLTGQAAGRRACPLFDPSLDRQRLDHLRQRCGDGRPVVLALVGNGHDEQRHIDDLAGRLDGLAHLLVLTVLDTRRLALRLAPLSTALVRLVFDHERHLDQLIGVLREIRVERLHVHDVAPDQPWMQGLVDALQLPLDLTIRSGGGFGPDADARAGGDATAGWLLGRAERVLVPSLDSESRIKLVSPDAPTVLATDPITVFESSARLSVTPPPLEAEEALRVVVIGPLTPERGSRILGMAAALAMEHQLPLAFHLLGVSAPRLKSYPDTALREHGPYQDGRLPRLLGDLNAHIAWFPDQQPDVYGYRLAAALQAGLPIAASAMGALPERLAGREWSWIQPADMLPELWLEYFLTWRTRHFQAGAAPQPASGRPAAASAYYPQAYLQPMLGEKVRA